MDLTAFDSVIKLSFINWDNIDRIIKKENIQFSNVFSETVDVQMSYFKTSSRRICLKGIKSLK